MSTKGRFKPKNPHKYKGNPANIIYRSSWELKLMNYLDTHEEVVQWSSEEFCIPYRSPIDNRIHRYFPDFWIKNSKEEVMVIEVKPSKQTLPPAVPKKKTPRYIQEVLEYGKNQAKWKSAREFCADRNWQFVVMTEKELNIRF
jgi:hypothetical protein